MDFLKDFFDWIKRITAGSREKEDKIVRKDEKKEKKLSRRKEKIQREESKTIKRIVQFLEDADNRITKSVKKGGLNQTRIKIGQQSIFPSEACRLLAYHLKKLEQTADPLHIEEEKVRKLSSYWSLVRTGLLNNVAQAKFDEWNKWIGRRDKDIKEIDEELQQLGIEIKGEEKITEEKIQVLKDEYRLLKAER